jgi:hypothetical protein
LLHAGNDITIIALWHGCESVATTQIYLQADMALKQQALDRRTQPASIPGRYKPPDELLAFPEARCWALRTRLSAVSADGISMAGHGSNGRPSTDDYHS